MTTRFEMPHIFAVLFLVIILAAALTWIVPAGQFERTTGLEGRLTVVPGTFHGVARAPQGLMDVLRAVPRGLIDAGAVVFAVFIVGGTFGVLNATQTISVGVWRFARAFRRREILMIPVIMTLFSLIASVIGNPELSLVYIPILLALCLAVGWDSMSAVAITLIGVTAGFATALMNPFSVGLAQQIAELPLGSGIGYRLIALSVFLLSGILYTMNYVRRVNRSPASSLTADEDSRRPRTNGVDVPEGELRHVWTGLVMLGAFAILVYGILQARWYMIELAALFVGVSMLTGLINRMRLNQIAEEFTIGCQRILVGAIVIGLSRGIALILEDGQIMDTLVFGLANLAQGFPEAFNAAGMLVVQFLMNFAVPSSSGQAVIAMPIMIPLADLVGVTRQTAVLAFQLGDGLSNILFPTSGYFMATLAMAGVPYHKWVRFFGPLLAIWFVLGIVALSLAQFMAWQ